MGRYYFFARQAKGNAPAGFTVSKHGKLPPGAFYLTQYTWGSVSLWFVDDDCFTADERQKAVEQFMGVLKSAKENQRRIESDHGLN